MKTLNETLKEFDEKFLLDNSDYELMKKRGVFGGKELLESIKSFIQEEIKTALESVVPEKENNANVSEYYSGYNACREQLLKNIDEYLK